MINNRSANGVLSSGPAFAQLPCRYGGCVHFHFLPHVFKTSARFAVNHAQFELVQRLKIINHSLLTLFAKYFEHTPFLRMLSTRLSITSKCHKSKAAMLTKYFDNRAKSGLQNLNLINPNNFSVNCTFDKINLPFT